MPSIQVAEAPGVGLDGHVRPSEDVVAVLPGAVLLLDGATALRPGQRSGGWYAGLLAGRLTELLTAEPDADLAGTLAAAITAVAGEHRLVRGEAPCSTVAIARWNESTVDALVLADSPVVAFTARGVEPLVDDRLARQPRSSGAGGYRDALRRGSGFGAAHLSSLRTSSAKLVTRRNTDGGFWVAEADPAAAYQARRASWPRAEVRSVLLASDGVSCGVDDYRIFPDWPAVLDVARRRGAEAVLEAVRQAERTDPDGRRWPRPKPHDDQALVVVDFS